MSEPAADIDGEKIDVLLLFLRSPEMQIAQSIREFARDESGVTAMEYGLIAGFMSLAIVVGVTAGGTALKTIFGAIGTQLGAAATALG